MCPPCPSQALCFLLNRLGSGRRKGLQNQGVILGTITKVTEAERLERERESCLLAKGRALLGTDLFFLLPGCLPIWGPLYPHTLPTGLKVPQTRSCLKLNSFHQPETVREPRPSHMSTENNCHSSRKWDTLILTPKAELCVLSERHGWAPRC